jgi:hypothetical protein
VKDKREREKEAKICLESAYLRQEDRSPIYNEYELIQERGRFG